MENKTLNYALAITTCVVVILGTYVFWPRKEKVRPYTTIIPAQRHLKQLVTASGTLKARDELIVGSLLAGRVIKVEADDNDKVKKGQLLVLLDNGIGDSAVKQLQAAVQIQEAELAYQEKNYKRQQELYESEQLSQDAFEQFTRDLLVRRGRLTQALAELEIRQKEYENLSIRSPDDGVVIARKVSLGQMVTSILQATELFIVAKDLRKMEAEIDVDEADVGKVKVGQYTSFTVDSFPEIKFEGKVKQIDYRARVIDNVVTFATTLDVPNPDEMLRPGMTTNVEILVDEDKESLAVPNRALRVSKKALQFVAAQEGIGFYPLEPSSQWRPLFTLWVVEDNAFKQIKVELGVKDRSYTQVKSGLKQGQRIVTDVVEPPRENLLLKQVFGQAAGGIGKK